MKIAKDTIVSIDYTLKGKDGQLIDATTKEDGPLVYLHGYGNLIQGLETKLEGRSVDETISVIVSPEDAYGLREDNLIDDVPRGNFPQPEELEIGSQIVAETDDGEALFTVIELSENSVKLDGNHPLAGMELHFFVKIKSIRAATQDEIENQTTEKEHD